MKGDTLGAAPTSNGIIGPVPRARQCLTAALLLLVLMTACGRIVTPEPSVTPRIAGAPTSTPNEATSASASPVGRQSPPDTATPTITPTPIFHVVGKGDTLQAIAFDFGVSVEALQAANGIENPQFLQVGQRLVIPVEEEGEEPGTGHLLPTPTPHPLQVQGVAFYQTPVGSLLGLGEIANTTDRTLTNIQVEATLLDESGARILTTNSFVAMDLVPPGSRCPFSVLFTTPPSDWTSYQVNVIRGQDAGVLSTAYVPLSVIGADGRQSDPQYEVSGRVKNESATQSAESVEVIVTTYDDAGAVTGFRRTMVSGGSGVGPGGLGPGEEMAFTVFLTTHADGAQDFAATALGRAAGGVNSGG